VIPLAEVFRRHWPAYQAQFGDRIPSSHRRAAQAIMACGTPMLGGQILRCTDCHKEIFIFHSCNHRACPRCGGKRSAEWLDRQMIKLLPVAYFLVTFTVPEELRAWCRSHPKEAYNLLFREASATLMEIGADPKHLGAELGFIAVLHTWTRQLDYHPHLHLIVPGGGLTGEGEWKQVGTPEFFLPQAVLAARFRNRLKAALQKDHQAWRQVPVRVWGKAWVVDCQAAGSGQNVLKYLARYVGKTALSSSRILQDDGTHITFSYQDAEDKTWRNLTVTAREFLRRFLQHVLPSGLQRVRYYGFLAPAAKSRWEQIVRLLDFIPVAGMERFMETHCCPFCQGHHLVLIAEFPRPP
jgi:hypothetical protein